MSVWREEASGLTQIRTDVSCEIIDTRFRKGALIDDKVDVAIWNGLVDNAVNALIV